MASLVATHSALSLCALVGRCSNGSLILLWHLFLKMPFSVVMYVKNRFSHGQYAFVSMHCEEHARFILLF